MAKEVNLTGKLGKKLPAASGTFGLPKAAEPGGVTGTLPMQTNQIFKLERPSPAEAAVLTSLGWQPGDPIPGDLAERLAKIEDANKQDMANVPPPLPLDTPPLKAPNTIPFADIPAEKQAELRNLLEQAKVTEAEEARFQSGQIVGAGQGVNEAIAVGRGASGNQYVVENDTASETYGTTGLPKASATGATGEHRTHCQHCSHDLSQPSPQAPTDDDKSDFLQSVLGAIPFSKSYEFFGGQWRVTLRTLAPAEVDLCYKQCSLLRKRGGLESQGDFIEQLMRYRLMLQLVQVRSKTIVDLPDSIEEWTSAFAVKDRKPTDDDTILALIEPYLLENVLRSESIHRMLHQTVSEFNRLVIKLEVNMQNSDFWEAKSEGR